MQTVQEWIRQMWNESVAYEDRVAAIRELGACDEKTAGQALVEAITEPALSIDATCALADYLDRNPHQYGVLLALLECIENPNNEIEERAMGILARFRWEQIEQVEPVVTEAATAAIVRRLTQQSTTCFLLQYGLDALRAILKVRPDLIDDVRDALAEAVMHGWIHRAHRESVIEFLKTLVPAR